MVDFVKQPRIESSDAFREERLVDRHDLRNVHDRRPRKPGPSRRDTNVSGGLGQTQIRGEDSRDYRADATFVEAV